MLLVLLVLLAGRTRLRESEEIAEKPPEEDGGEESPNYEGAMDEGVEAWMSRASCLKP